MSTRDLLPSTDAATFARQARRTRLIRGLTSLVLAAALAYCASFVLLHAGRAGAGTRSQPRPTIVVLDVSGSIENRAAQTASTLLRSVAASGDAGLVLFSDTAYTALPARSASKELLGYARAFRNVTSVAQPPGAPSVEGAGAGVPWESFTSGTEMSTGLARARQQLAREGVRSAEIVVASDFFDDASDLPALRRELHAYRRLPGVTFAAMPLPPSSETGLATFRRAAPSGVALHHPVGRRAQGGMTTARSSAAAIPLSASLLVAACLLFIALATDAVFGTPLSWRTGAR